MINFEIKLMMIATYPTRRLWGKVNHGANDDRCNNGAAQHQPPGNIRGNVGENDGDDIAECDTEGGPHLPLHDQSSTDGCRSTLGSVNRGSSRFRTNTKTEEKTSNEKLRP